jgi:hypothetical protein
MIYGLVQWFSDNLDPFMEIWNRKDIIKLHREVHEKALGLVKGMSKSQGKLQVIYSNLLPALKHYYHHKKPIPLKTSDLLWSEAPVHDDAELLSRLFFHVIHHQSFDPSYISELDNQNWPRSVEYIAETFVDIYNLSPLLYEALNGFAGPAKARQDLQNLVANLQTSNNKSSLYFLDFLATIPSEALRGPSDPVHFKRRKKATNSKLTIRGAKPTPKPTAHRPTTNTRWDDVESQLIELGKRAGRLMAYTDGRLGGLDKTDSAKAAHYYRQMHQLQTTWKESFLVTTFSIIFFSIHLLILFIRPVLS